MSPPPTSHHWSRRSFGGALGLLGLGAGASCTRGGSDPATTVTVLAASSLVDAFAELRIAFEGTNPGVDVVVSTAGSQALRLQIVQGAPADVFASANPAHMDALRREGLVRDVVTFAKGTLVLVVPRGNPAGLRSLADLPRARRVVMGTEEVPIGAYTRTVLERAESLYGPGFRSQVEARVVSLEPNVRLVLAKVELGEADAAIVYRSDTIGAGAGGREGPREVEVIELPDLGVTPRYHVGVLTAAAAPALADRFVAHLRSELGRTVLTRHGFGAPDG
ncbi:MAG: molybdate ABC transporter substrate-binding protein [Nannocystaceae bacterium]